MRIKRVTTSSLKEKDNISLQIGYSGFLMSTVCFGMAPASIKEGLCCVHVRDSLSSLSLFSIFLSLLTSFGPLPSSFLSPSPPILFSPSFKGISYFLVNNKSVSILERKRCPHRNKSAKEFRGDNDVPTLLERLCKRC